jgi:hypothetical protein
MLSLCLFSALVAAEGLPRDDTYHQYVVTDSNLTLWIQPWPSHSAILCIHDKKYTFHASVKPLDGDWTKLTSEEVDRTGDYKETRYTFTNEYPQLFGISCDNPPCPMVLEHVHTDPVFRRSAVVGAFALFVCLFLLVLSWAIFCGACRATRKR